MALNEIPVGHSVPNHQRILDPLRFWWNLVYLLYLWCFSLIPIFSSTHHIFSDLWPQIFWIAHKNWFVMSYEIPYFNNYFKGQSTLFNHWNFCFEIINTVADMALLRVRSALLKTLIMNISKNAVSNSLNFLAKNYWVMI